MENKIFCPGRQMRHCYPSHSESNHSVVTFVLCFRNFRHLILLTNWIIKQTYTIYLSGANISSCLCNSKEHQSAHNSQPMVHILGHIESSPDTQLPFLDELILILPAYLLIFSEIMPFALPLNFWMRDHLPMHATTPYLTFSVSITLTIFSGLYKSWAWLLRTFL
jgi:hypothetical protein